MRPYGMTRLGYYDVDVAGILENGRAAAVANLPGRGGDIRALRSARASKAGARRRLARVARLEGKAACRIDD